MTRQGSPTLCQRPLAVFPRRDPQPFFERFTKNARLGEAQQVGDLLHRIALAQVFLRQALADVAQQVAEDHALGFWLSNIGKPYNGLLFNIHKLIALGAVVLAVIQLTKIPNLLMPPSLVLAALSVIALFVSGALMSAGKLDYALMLTIHRIGLATLIIGRALALLEKRP